MNIARYQSSQWILLRGITSALAALLLLSISVLAQERSFVGKVVGITDGDTIKVLHDGQPEKIRLSGIDCPEKRQPFGQKAKEFTASLCAEKTVTIETHGHDRYGRTIGEVVLSDKRIVNQELVKAGFAWWYRKYAPGDTTLQSLEASAHAKHLGLWQDAHPIAPWDWRHSRHRTEIGTAR